jgi:DNA-directed RNA polymerase subunit D
MKLEKIAEEKKKGKLSFLLKDSDEIFANTIRRIIIEEVPTLAVEDLEIKENSSALYDEMLALRIGLIPIKTDLRSYELKQKCKCKGEGCARCELKMSLKVGKKGYVCAEETESTDPKCTFVYPHMPLTKLLAKQKVDINMTAILGQGKDHTKWVPGLVFYKKEPVIKIKGKIADAEAIAKACPKGIFAAKNEKITLNEEKVYDCHLCQQCVELDKNITLEDSGNFIFNVESWGQLNCKDILEKSAEILIEKIEEMEKII